MSALFCCDSVRPYRPQRLLREDKFKTFMTWAAFPKESTASTGGGAENVELMELNPPYAIQLVRQVNYGPLESKRYFIPAEGKDNEFLEVVEDDLVRANFQKLNSYKNFKCESHNKFFEVNVYQKNPVNLHHWRANITRPAGGIDL
ncbi:hypothetical protein C8A03DRAFT_17497 [Achaetomium macrosporum]|uniref:Uncharacterized protein n=1 Tax=Achaetomium macrosporum TaxID=79813 RepID=A0AAN7HCB9_9PEZI|nr:hypothetical protein C8A03DRAFT_17497 [Achaetomium macrosporum]